MADDAQLQAAVTAETRALLDEQLSNLSERVFEIGKQLDRQLALWLSFAALTLLFGFGLTENASVAGLTVDTSAGAAIAYALSCVFYYRVAVGNAVLGVWRTVLRERRAMRYAMLLSAAERQGAEVRDATLADVHGLIREYPGYVSSSVLLKDRTLGRSDVTARFVRATHYIAVGAFLAAPYALAAAIVVTAGWTAAVVVVAIAGLLVTLSGNALINLRE